MHGILQPRTALEGIASTACTGDGMLQGLRLRSGSSPLRGRDWAKNLSRAPDTGRKSPRKAEAAEDKSPPAPKHSHQPFPSGQTTELRPTGSQPTLQQHQGAAAWERCTTPAHTVWRAAGQPPSFTLEHQPFPVYSQRRSAQQGGAASPLLQSHAQPR